MEGYSNFSWVLLLALGISLGSDPEILAPLLGALCGGGVLLLMAGLEARRAGWGSPSIWLVPGLLALNRSFAGWSTGGLETQLFSLLLLGGYASLVCERRRLAPRPWLSSLLLSLAAITRADGALFLVPAGLCFAADVLLRRRSFGSLAVWALPVVFIVGLHLLWRHSYYGFWLPNTFYAKVGGLWWEQGLYYLGRFFSGYSLYWFLPLGVLALAVRREFISFLFATILVVHFTYLTAIGGDFLEYRFLVPSLPYLYWLIVEGIRVLAEREPSGGWRRVAQRAAAAAVLVALGAATLRSSLSEQPRMLGGGIEGIEATRLYADARVSQGRKLRELVERGLLPRELRWQTRGVGAIPYYTEWYTLDELGLNDLYVARWEGGEHGRGRIAHERQAPLGYSRAMRIQLLEAGPHLLQRLSREELVVRKSRLAERWKKQLGRQREAELHCFEVEPGTYLLFRSTVGRGEVQSLFAKLDPC